MSIDREKLARALYEMNPIEDWSMDIVEWHDVSRSYRETMAKHADRIIARIDAGEFA